MKKKSSFTIVILIIYSISYGYSQSDNAIMSKQNSLYIEILGISGSFISYNVDRIIKQKENYYIDVSAGFGYSKGYHLSFGNEYNPMIGIPLSINFTNGKKNKHFEFGIGLTYNSGLYQKRTYVQNSPDKIESQKTLLGTFRLGFKRQKPNGGIFYRIGFTHLFKLVTFSNFNRLDDVNPLFGFGLGYSF